MKPMTRNAPVLLLGLAMALVTAVTLAWTLDMTFFQDTWAYLIERREITFDTVLRPHNEHIVAIPVLIEQLFLRVFGMSTAAPEHLLLMIMLLVTAYLFFVYVKRRVGPWPALFAAVLVLFLGPAYEVLLWPFEICFVGSMLFGLATLLALEREDTRGDLSACVFLVLSLGFSSLGITFIVGAFAAVLVGARDRWLRRAYVFAVPTGFFILWYLGWGHVAESHVTLHNVLLSPRFMIEGLAASLGSIFALNGNNIVLISAPSPDPSWGRPLLILLAVGLVFKQARKPGFFPGLWAAAATLTAYWLLAAFNHIPGRDPIASRYQYAGAILLFMVVANLMRGVEVSRRVLLVGGAVALIVLGPNLVALKDGKDWLGPQSVFTRADTAAIEIARRTVDPGFSLTPEIAGTPSLININAKDYLTAVDEYGSPAYTPDQLAVAPEEGRRQADIILARILPLSTKTLLGTYRSGVPGRDCTTLPAGGGSPDSEVRLSPGVTRIELPPGPPAAFTLRRFAAEGFPVETEGAAGGSVTLLRIPRDEATQPWFLHAEAKQPVRVCR